MRTLIIKKGGNDMLKEFMEQVLAKLDQNEENFEKVSAKLEEHDKEFEKINAKLDEHDRRFEEIDNNFKIVNARLDAHDRRFEEIDNNFVDIAENFKLINLKLSDHDKQFKEIKNCLLVLEDKITNELPALFDGFSANVEKSTVVEFKQKAIEQKEELDSLRISSLEDISKQHSEQISKLLAK